MRKKVILLQPLWWNKFKPKYKSQYINLIEETYDLDENEQNLDFKIPNYRFGVKTISSDTKNKNERLTKLEEEV